MRCPSEVFPKLTGAICDTEHRRPPDKAPLGGTTTLVPIFMGFY